MHSPDWNKQDDFTLHLYSPVNTLLDRGHEGLDEALDFIDSLDEQLRTNGLGEFEFQILRVQEQPIGLVAQPTRAPARTTELHTLDISEGG